MLPALKKAARLLCYLGRHDRALWISWAGEETVGEWKCLRCRCGVLLPEPQQEPRT